jgi:tRNA (cytidine/uridine-2'-O-)-methyltransferase
MPGDCLVFGSETKGLPQELLESESDGVLCIPIDRSRVRSLNMATAVAVVLFEATRQLTLYQNKSFSWFPYPISQAFESCGEVY